MPNVLSQLTKGEQTRLFEELNYMNLEEIRGSAQRAGSLTKSWPVPERDGEGHARHRSKADRAGPCPPLPHDRRGGSAHAHPRRDRPPFTLDRDQLRVSHSAGAIARCGSISSSRQTYRADPPRVRALHHADAAARNIKDATTNAHKGTHLVAELRTRPESRLGYRQPESLALQHKPHLNLSSADPLDRLVYLIEPHDVDDSPDAVCRREVEHLHGLGPTPDVVPINGSP